MTTFLLIRHGITAITGSFLTSRQPGHNLNEEGRRQAERIADSLTELDIAAVYTSPMERARQTAAPLAERKGLRVDVTDAFTEIDFGAWTGRSIKELERSDDWLAFNRFRSSLRPPGGESILDVQHRMIPELEALRLKHHDQRIAIFSHGDPIRAALLHYLGLGGDALHRLDIAPASVSIVDIEDWGARVIAINRILT